MLCYPGNKVEATISFNSMDIIGQRGHEIHNPDFIDAPAKPGSGALNWENQPSTPTPEGQLTVSGDISAYHNWGSATGIYWIEPRDTVGIPPNAKDNPTTKMQNVTSGKVRGPGLDRDNFLSLRKWMSSESLLSQIPNWQVIRWPYLMLTNTLFFLLFYTGHSFSQFWKSSDAKKNLPWKNGPWGPTRTQVYDCLLLPGFTHTHTRTSTHIQERRKQTFPQSSGLEF